MENTLSSLASNLLSLSVKDNCLFLLMTWGTDKVALKVSPICNNYKMVKNLLWKTATVPHAYISFVF